VTESHLMCAFKSSCWTNHVCWWSPWFITMKR